MHAKFAPRHWIFLAVLALSAPALGVIATAPAGAAGSTGTVTGTVTSTQTGKPLKNICVNVVEASTNTTVGTSSPSTSKGVWTLAAVPTSADYTAITIDCKGGDYVGQWFDNQDFQSNATQFAVSSGATTSGINFSLSEGGAIAGKVTDATTKKPVAGILVIAYWTTADQVAGAVCTTTKGTYKISGLATSGAKLEFVPGECGVSSSYATTWYGGVDYPSATVVSVTAKRTTTKIDQTISS